MITVFCEWNLKISICTKLLQIASRQLIVCTVKLILQSSWLCIFSIYCHWFGFRALFYSTLAILCSCILHSCIFELFGFCPRFSRIFYSLFFSTPNKICQYLQQLIVGLVSSPRENIVHYKRGYLFEYASVKMQNSPKACIHESLYSRQLIQLFSRKILWCFHNVENEVYLILLHCMHGLLFISCTVHGVIWLVTVEANFNR